MKTIRKKVSEKVTRNKWKAICGVLFCCMAVMTLSSLSFADNPIVQTNFTADPAPMVYNDTVYVYTTHDEDGSTYFTMNDWKCYSSTDMVNWTDHGTVLSLKDISWAESDAWAAQCIEKDGQFYLYVPIKRKNGGKAIGVAVSDSPTGPFSDPLKKPLIDLSTWEEIDPAVYVDDDGQAYLYWGNPALKFAKLKDDMISIYTEEDENIKAVNANNGIYSFKNGIYTYAMTTAAFGVRSNTERPTSYEEGPWVYKRNDTYYMVFAAGPISEHIGYSTSDNPYGPWKYQGVVMSTQGSSFTNHPGVLDDYKGKSYFFYHNGALPGGGGYTRSVCVEELKYRYDEQEGMDKIIQMNMTSAGPSPVDVLNPYARKKAATIAWSTGLKTEAYTEDGSNVPGEVNVCQIHNDDSIKVREVDFGEAGAGTFTANVACGTNPKVRQGGTIEIRLDGKNGPLIGTLPVSYTGGWNVWKDKTTNVSNAAGLHDVFFVFKGTHKNELFKMYEWEFRPKGDENELVSINATIDQYKIDKKEGSNTAKINVTAIYADGTTTDVTDQALITSNATGVVEIGNDVSNTDGVRTRTIKGLDYGETMLTASFGEETDEVGVIVKDVDSEFIVSSLVLSKSSITLNVGGRTENVTVTAKYADGHEEDVSGKVTQNNPDPSVATYTNGRITAKAEGTVDITLSFKDEIGEEVTTKLSITVIVTTVSVKGVTLSPKTLNVMPGESATLTATVTPTNATNKSIKWSSNDPSIAAVDQNGTVTAVSPGTAVITAESQDGSGHKDTCTVSVSPIPVTGILLNANSLNLKVGSSEKLTATVTPDNATNKNLSWTSSNPNVASVGKDGTVTAIAAGTANITVEALDGSGTKNVCLVTVNPVNDSNTVNYQITYRLNGGKNNESNPDTYVKEAIIAFANPTRAKHTFEGWYLESNFKTKVSEVSGKDVTVYAKWKKVSVSKAKIKSLKNNKSKQVKLTVNKVNGAKGYQLVYATNAKFTKGKKTVTLKNTSCNVRKLKKGSTYYFKVRAYQLDSVGKKVYGKYGSVRKVKVKK